MENFIGQWYIDDLLLCDKIINYHKICLNKKPGLSYDSCTKLDSVNTNIKDSSDVKISIDSDIALLYSIQLKKIINNYIERFPYCTWGTDWGLLEEINIQHYLPGGGYKTWHCERSSSVYPKTARHLVFMTYLNDVVDGGETEFLHQKIKVKPVKGLTLIWPADWTYTHRGIPSATSEKYIITGWLSFLA